MVMPTWARFTLRTVGALNFGLAALGAYFLSKVVLRTISSHGGDPSVPYFHQAFWVLTTVNVAFLFILATTAVRFIQLRVSAVKAYSISVAALIIYAVANGGLWLVGRGIGKSIASVSGIGNMGIGPFVLIAGVPYLYPVVSVVLLQVLRSRALRDSFSSAPSQQVSAQERKGEPTFGSPYRSDRGDISLDRLRL